MGPGLLAQEDQDRHERGNGAADLGINAEHGIGTQPGSGNVADVEDDAAKEDQAGQEPPDAGDHLVAEFLRAQPRNADNPPDVHLDRDVDEDRRQDGESEGSANLGGEDRGLGDEAGPDGAGGHQEHGSQEGRAPSRGAQVQFCAGFCHGSVQY